MLVPIIYLHLFCLLISEYGLGNEVSIQGDVYSYGILLLEMFTGKRPTDSEFGEALSLRKYVEMALPERVANIIHQNLLQEAEDGEARSTTSRRNKDMEIACIASILRIGTFCLAETPTDRPRIGDALKDLESIRDKLRKDLLQGLPRYSRAQEH
jgi:serine/threonine protein kinase